MRRTSHKTTMADVLRFLLDGPQRAYDIGAHFWPDKIGFGPAHGGPASASVSASRLLGRMRRRQWVDQDFKDSRWYLTDSGHKKLRESSIKEHVA